MVRRQLSADGMQDGGSHGGVEARTAARINLFLAATLRLGDASHPVKIRDLSATGARIETQVPLKVGAAVTVVRGGLSVHARVGWHADRFCGLSFAAPVSTDDWKANPANLQPGPGSPALPIQAPAAMPVRWQAEIGGSVADQLSQVSRWLVTFGHALADDPNVVFKYGSELFSLSLAARSLGVMADTMQAESSAFEPGASRPQPSA